MRCWIIKKDVSAYVDGELDERGKSVVESHLQVCPDCKRLLNDFIGQGKLLNQLSEIESSSTFDARFWDKLQKEELGQGLRQPFLVPVFLKRVPVAAMAVLILLVGVLGGVFSFLTQRRFISPAGFEAMSSPAAAISLGLRAFDDVSPNSVESAYLKLSGLRRNG